MTSNPASTGLVVAAFIVALAGGVAGPLFFRTLVSVTIPLRGIDTLHPVVLAFITFFPRSHRTSAYIFPPSNPRSRVESIVPAPLLRSHIRVLRASGIFLVRYTTSTTSDTHCQ